MTTAEQSTVRREVTDRTGQTYIVTVAPEGLYMREKGSRAEPFLLPWGIAFVRAATLAADATIETRKAKRTSRGLLR